jgi:hypothetical protein
MSEGPDFVYAGMQKAGSGWLYDQLADHRDVWMTPMKELHFLDDVDRTGVTAGVRRMPTRQLRACLRHPVPIGFWARALRPGRSTLDQYAALFRAKGGRITGDITPAYSTLSQSMIARAVERFPHVRAVLIARDPVERIWSARRGRAMRGGPDDWEPLQRLLESTDVGLRSSPSETYLRWSSVIPTSRLHVAFFDDLQRDPRRVRDGVASFLGLDPMRFAERVDPTLNRKGGSPPIPAAVRARLAAAMRDELLRCAEVLGPPARQWLDRYEIE